MVALYRSELTWIGKLAGDSYAFQEVAICFVEVEIHGDYKAVYDEARGVGNETRALKRVGLVYGCRE
jgi:hypothetical protein